MMQHGYLAYPNQTSYQMYQNPDQKAMHRPNDSVPEAKKDFLFNLSTKARYDNMQQQQNAPITKVVSLRNIPNDTTDLQMVLIGSQFGEVVNILYIKGKGQALIEFTNLKEANDMIQYFHHIPEHCSLKGVEAAHSSYQQLTIDNNRAASTISTIQLAKQLKESALIGGDNHVIKAQFTNIVYPICIDALYQIFSKCGNVLKIILIQKNDLSALIQMKDAMQTQQAIANLNGRNMYNSYAGPCNILNLTVSRHKKIDVVANNSKTWDYTNPLLPLAEPQMNNGVQGLNQNAGGHGMLGQGQAGLNKGNMIADHPLLPMPMNMAAAAAAVAAAAAAAGSHPFNTASPFLTGQQPNLHQSIQSQQQSQGQQVGNPYNQVAAVAQSVGGYPMQSIDTRPAVIQVANFPEQIANPDALFTLFGVYGDILKVKIMFNRRDNALLQYKSYDQAINAVQKMDKVKLFEKVLSVNMSKFPEIQIPIKNVNVANDGGLAKDYSTSPLHRFKKPGSKNFFNIFPPNVSLHLSNISPNTSQEQVTELFAKHGTIKNFKWISKEGNKMALIELSALEEAVLALISLHNFQLNGSYLRVNFAK